MRCVSCNIEVKAEDGFSIFKCPSCGETIVRCRRCRANSVPYKCPKCGFEGP